LAALPFWRLGLDPAAGSTVEARGCEDVSKSAGWRVGGAEIPQRLVDCQSASNRDPRSASKRDPFVLRFERLALAPSELVGVAETARARVVV